MSRDFEAVLDECLNQMNEGKSITACLAQHPAMTAELEPLLRIAFQLKSLRQDQQLSPAALWTARQRVLHRATQLRSAWEKPRRGHVPLWLNLSALMRKSVAAIVLAILLLGTILGGGTIAASAKSLPGDALYPVKRVTEEFRLLITFDQQAKAQLRQQFDERRREEAKAVASRQRVAEMSFRGQIEDVADDHWTIGGVPVNVSSKTIIEGGDIAVGALVQVHVRSLSDGTLLAIRVSVEPGVVIPEPTVSPTPTLTPTPVPTYTEVPATALPAPVSPPTTTPSPTFTLIPTATPSATATEIPATPTPPREVKIRFKGKIEAIMPGVWTIGGQVVRVDEHTRFDEQAGKAAVGAIARVIAIRQADSILLAIEITIERAAQAPGQPFEFQGLIESFAPTQWVVGDYTVLITADTIIEGNPQKGLLAEVKALLQSDGSLHATHIIVKLPTEEVQFEGVVQDITAEEWVVDGVIVHIDSQTVIEGTPAIGCSVEIQGLLMPDGAVLGRRIVVQQPSMQISPTVLPTCTSTTETVPDQTPAASKVNKGAVFSSVEPPSSSPWVALVTASDSLQEGSSL